LSNPTEQQVRDVLGMMRESNIVEMDYVIYADNFQSEHVVADLHSISSTNKFIEALKEQGDIEESL